jgi:hypothetical protein
MRKFAAVSAILLLAGCAETSEVMDTGNGTYMITASAMRIRGGAVKAKEMAYDQAKAFCGSRGKHAVVLGVDTDTTYSSSFGGSVNPSGGSFGGSTAAHQTHDFHFRCQ